VRPPGLRDPRLVIGVVVMAVSVLAGAMLLGDHDRDHTALALRHDLRPGQSVRTSDLRVVRAELADAGSAARYFLDGARPGPGTSTDRDLSAGELLPRSAVGARRRAPVLEVPLSVGVDDLPATVRVGSTVDVWVVPEAARSAADPRAELVLAQVPVLHIGGGGDALAPDGTRQVIVGVEGNGQDQQRSLAAALGREASGRVLITRRT